MIRSMTGYGQASAEVGEARLSIEIRSVNHRYADLRLRLPQELAASETAIRRKILRRVKRGRVEMFVNVETLRGGTAKPQLNQELLREVLAAAAALGDELEVEGTVGLDTVLGVHGMFRNGPVELEWNDDQRAVLDASIAAALDALDRERLREGQHLREELTERLVGMAGIAAEIRERAAGIPSTLRDRLVERLKALSTEVELDPARVAQEAVILADRHDVTEELVRLDGHLEQARALLETPDGDPVGKRLDFLLQEIQRETNTVNSKSGDLGLSRKALDLKAEIEKVREQVQNLE